LRIIKVASLSSKGKGKSSKERGCEVKPRGLEGIKTREGSGQTGFAKGGILDLISL